MTCQLESSLYLVATNGKSSYLINLGACWDPFPKLSFDNLVLIESKFLVIYLCLNTLL